MSYEEKRSILERRHREIEDKIRAAQKKIQMEIRRFIENNALPIGMQMEVQYPNPAIKPEKLQIVGRDFKYSVHEEKMDIIYLCIKIRSLGTIVAQKRGRVIEMSEDSYRRCTKLQTYIAK